MARTGGDVRIVPPPLQGGVTTPRRPATAPLCHSEPVLTLAWESVFLVKSPKTTQLNLSKTEKSKKYSEKPCTPPTLVL